MPRRVQRKHQIDHGEPGANEQRAFATCSELPDRRLSRTAPGIADQPVARASEGAQRLRLLIAARKNERLGLDRAAVAKLDMPAAITTSCGRCGRVHGCCAAIRFAPLLTK